MFGSTIQRLFSFLFSNKISELVEGDPRLRDLEELYLSKNNLETVPDLFMASMLSLKILDISHNQLGEPGISG